MSRLPLRVRLVGGFLVAMLVLLTAAGAFVYWRVEYALDRGLDTELSHASDTISPLVDVSGQVASAEAADATGVEWQVLDGAGNVLQTGGGVPEKPLVSPADLTKVGGGTLTEDIGSFLPASSKPYRVQVTSVGSGDLYLLVATRRNHRDEALRELLAQLALAGLGALAVTGLVGDTLARAALRPVERFRRRAEDIAGGADGLRLDVPSGRDDEVTRLGHTLNDMLANLEQSLDHERRFVNDASHELRTPLTLLTSRIQLARRRSRSIAEHEAVLDELAVDVDRLGMLAEQLLALGSADEGAVGQADMRVVASVVEHRRVSRPQEAHDISLELPGTITRAAIDPLPLERIITNLIENAFTHGRPPIRIRVRQVRDLADGEWVLIEVEDAGPGMDPDLLARASHRFTRSPDARGRPGSGLGLSLVDNLVAHAGGELRTCFDGTHHRHANRASVDCDHGSRMTVSVFLVAAAP